MNSVQNKQLDFWPDQRSSAMVAIARLSHVSAHRSGCARSGSEDATVAVRVRRASVAEGAPLGMYGESSFPVRKK